MLGLVIVVVLIFGPPSAWLAWRTFRPGRCQSRYDTHTWGVIQCIRKDGHRGQHYETLFKHSNGKPAMFWTDEAQI